MGKPDLFESIRTGPAGPESPVMLYGVIEAIFVIGTQNIPTSRCVNWVGALVGFHIRLTIGNLGTRYGSVDSEAFRDPSKQKERLEGVISSKTSDISSSRSRSFRAMTSKNASIT